MHDVVTPILSGAMAGCAVDMALYPIDTIKTRLQSAQGFRAAGGFKGVYNGVNAAFVGSIPGAALFFAVYENLRKRIAEGLSLPEAAADFIAAPIGECVACTVRAPVETVKQRMQVSTNPSAGTTLRAIYQKDGVGGFYGGYRSVVMREIPFGCIQFPIYEALKRLVARASHDGTVSALSAAACGSIAGATAAALTTPFDVVKTRIMLGQSEARLGVFAILQSIAREEGVGGLYKGVGPRVTWISLGGFIFFGMYNGCSNIVSARFAAKKPQISGDAGGVDEATQRYLSEMSSQGWDVEGHEESVKKEQLQKSRRK